MSEYDGVKRLTPRQREVLQLIAEGCSNHAISRSLVISERTVESYVNEIYAKLCVNEDPNIHPRVMAALIYLGRVQKEALDHL